MDSNWRWYWFLNNWRFWFLCFRCKILMLQCWSKLITFNLWRWSLNSRRNVYFTRRLVIWREVIALLRVLLIQYLLLIKLKSFLRINFNIVWSNLIIVFTRVCLWLFQYTGWTVLFGMNVWCFEYVIITLSHFIFIFI